MTAAQDLRDRIDEYTIAIANLDTMLTNLNAELANTQAEISTIDDGVLSASETDHLAKLEAIRAANGWDHIRTYGDYGVVNLTEWDIWVIAGTVYTIGLTRLSDNSFVITGLAPPTFIVNTPVEANYSVQRIVQSVVTVPAVSVTVTLTAGTALPNPLTSIQASGIIYSPTVNWNSDPGLLQAQDAFATGYDQINADISTSGTYGLAAREANISLGISVQTANRAAYQQFIDDYEPYAAP